MPRFDPRSNSSSFSSRSSASSNHHQQVDYISSLDDDSLLLIFDNLECVKHFVPIFRGKWLAFGPSLAGLVVWGFELFSFVGKRFSLD